MRNGKSRKPAPVRERHQKPARPAKVAGKESPAPTPPARPLFEPAVPPPAALPAARRVTITFSAAMEDVRLLDQVCFGWQQVRKNSKRVDRSWAIREAIRHYAVCQAASLRRHGYNTIGGAQMHTDDTLCTVDPLKALMQEEDPGPGPRKEGKTV